MQTMRALEKARLAKNRASNRYNTQNFNATKAFQNVGNRLELNKAKSELKKYINSRRPGQNGKQGNYMVGGGFGQVKRDLKGEVNRATTMSELAKVKQKVATKKSEKNAEIARRRMNQTLSKRGSVANFKFGNQTKPAAKLSKQVSYANAVRKPPAENRIRVGAP